MSTFDTARMKSAPLLGSCLPQTPEKRVRLVAMTAMAWTLAHEVSQPLTSAMNYLRACALQLRRRGEGFEDLLAMIEDAGKEATKAGDIIGRMRSFIVSGRVTARRENLRRMIGNAALSLASADRDNVAFVTTIAPDANHVIADRIQIEQALSIILLNACQALTGCSVRRISVNASRLGDQAVLLIEDSGPGMSDYVTTRVFEPFFTTRAAGMGLGMPICRAIVEAHGGRVWVEGGTSGGAVVGMSLPAAN